ncbi:OmpA family protein [Solimicrobium silvestre]|uniref:OmpA family n=1 Tax=Solimicrobium silvestre TaxID=2099400 RepID=A0A2S9GZ56_9BURK|nr:OmpA family protein [Solimicrobium silvestre]PRC93014.1 OmpA family [Solimicrobium silvestre]
MKKNLFSPTLLTIAVLISACSTVPRTTSFLEQTRRDYGVAQNNPNVARYAPLEMQQATIAMNQANLASTHDDSEDKINKLAYIAKDKIALAQEVTKQKLAEVAMASTVKERDQMVLNQRTAEADQAKMNAADSQRKTQEAQAHAAQLEAELADLAAKKTDRGMVITLGDVLFGTDLSRLNSNGMHTAQKLADVLNQNPQRTVLIEGFTDSTGTAPYNQELSERRAKAVRSALQDMGIAAERIAIRGYGQDFPVASNDTAGNRQMNRRVEIVLSDDNGKIAQR